MIGRGALINALGIVLGGLLGHFFGRFLGPRQQETLGRANGVSVLFIGVAGALQGMLRVDGGLVDGGQSLLVVISLALGALAGELLGIEGWFERFGEWLKEKTGDARDGSFVNGFVTASLTVCIGAMAVLGSIADGVQGDPSILTVKALLDLIIVMVMTSSLGKGCAFSAIPVLILEGGMTVLARLLQPILMGSAMDALSLVGSILIFCVGVNLVWGKTIRVANLLPAIVFAVALSYLPLSV